VIGALATTFIGLIQGWRPRTLALAAVTTLVLAACGEAVVFFLEFATHSCGE
jgi:hypothetical protein